MTIRKTAAALLLSLSIASSAAFAQEKLWDDLQEEAITLYQQKKHEEAVATQMKAFEIAKKTFGEESLNAAESMDNLAIYYQALGKNDEAEKMYEAALAIMEKKLPPDDSYLAIFMEYVADFYNKIGKKDREASLRARARSIRKAASASAKNAPTKR